MFRLVVRTQMVAGEIVYHVTGYRSEGDRAFAFCVATLRQTEWIEFLRFAEHDHRFEIEVANETFRANAPETPTPR